MELQDIAALIDRFDASSLQSLSLSQEGFSLTLGRGGAMPAAPAVSAPMPAQAAPAPETAATPAAEILVRAPLLGTFYRAGEPGAAPFVQPGDRVKKGQTLCIIEAMKTLSELPAPLDCTILEPLLEDGALAEYDAPLFRILPAGGEA